MGRADRSAERRGSRRRSLTQQAHKVRPLRREAMATIATGKPLRIVLCVGTLGVDGKFSGWFASPSAALAGSGCACQTPSFRAAAANRCKHKQPPCTLKKAKARSGLSVRTGESAASWRSSSAHEPNPRQFSCASIKDVWPRQRRRRVNSNRLVMMDGWRSRPNGQVALGGCGTLVPAAKHVHVSAQPLLSLR